MGWEFSGSGQYLYLFTGEFGTSIYQVDLDGMDESDPMAGAALINQPSGIVYFIRSARLMETSTSRTRSAETLRAS